MLSHGLEESFGRLIASGCDQRLIPGVDGLNPYGASILPRRAISLGSCSCSSPTDRATQAARRALDLLRRSSNVDHTVAKTQEGARKTLRETFEIAPEIDIALTPSGTDLEMLAVALVAGKDDRELVNVIVGPREVGSGTCNAASIRHYSTRLPRGGKATPGSAINDALAARVTLHQVDIRDQHGEILLPLEIDGAVTDIVIDAVSRGARVLVHTVAHSKTGIHAPTLPLMERLTQTIGNDFVGIVDAAQGRVAREAYQTALDRGWMVSFTGSKFFGGPPFAGALFVPPHLSPATTGLDQLPAGFEDYFSRRDLPESWFPVGLAEDWNNVGSVLRWAAATAEIKAYFGVDRTTRNKIAKAFAQAVHDCFDILPNVQLVKEFVCHDADGILPGIVLSPTVFSFEVTDDAGDRLDRDALKRLHKTLNTEIDGMRFHLGQPVMIGQNRAVLRVALGAPLVVDVARERSLGDSLDDRIGWMHNMLEQLSHQVQRLATSADIKQPS
nr:hypothetical protein [uncultured bacterium]